MYDRVSGLIEEVEFLATEQRVLAATGPQLRIIHRHHDGGSGCRPGEEVALISLVHRFRDVPLGLTLALRIFVDYLARHRRFPQSAAQIEAGIRADAFCLRHGANAKTTRRLTRRFSRSAVKGYVNRIRHAFMVAFLDAGLNLNPLDVLVSEHTEGNEVMYRLRASFEWIHLR